MGDDPRELTASEISRDVNRAVKFMSTLSLSRDIRRILDGRGYTAKEHKLGWRYLLAVMGWEPEPAECGGGGDQDKAIAELDQWDGPNFAVACVALRRRYPDQEAYVFQDLTARTGAAAVGSVKTYIDRVAALRDGTDPSRAAMRSKDKSAVATLETRKVAGADLEAHLAGLIKQATTVAPMPPSDSVVEDPESYQRVARDLHDWLSEWRETARAVITRRDYQIRLGLIARRTGGAEEE